jgi:hypothetical protein
MLLSASNQIIKREILIKSQLYRPRPTGILAALLVGAGTGDLRLCNTNTYREFKNAVNFLWR